MTNESVKKVYNLIILDESGSMQSIRQAVIDGFNEIIQSVRNAAARDSELQQWIHFFSFNGLGVREQIPLSEVTSLTELDDNTYRPNDTTPLYDAIGLACNKLLALAEKDTNYIVLVTILTDGEENSSKEYSFHAVSELIKSLKEKGWVFTYIGSNHDVEKVSVSLHITNSFHYMAGRKGMKDFVAKEKSSRESFYSKLKDSKPEELQKGYFESCDSDESE